MKTDTLIERAQNIVEDLGCSFDCVVPTFIDGDERILFTDRLTGSSCTIKLRDVTRKAVVAILKDSRSKTWAICDRLREIGLSDDDIATVTRDVAIGLLEQRG